MEAATSDAAPPSYEPVAGPSSRPPLSEAVRMTPTETKSLSTFLQVGRILDWADFFTLTSRGALVWDPRGENSPLAITVEKHGNVGAWIQGDREPPLVRLRNVSGVQPRGLTMMVSVPSGLLRCIANVQTVSVGDGIALHHPGHAVVGPSTRIQVDGISTLIGPASTLASPPNPIAFPLLASIVYLKPIQWIREGMPATMTAIRWRLVWADTRTQQSFLRDDTFVERFKDALDLLPSNDVAR